MTKKKTLPMISVVIPTLNEEKNIGTCLAAIRKQNYPAGKIEVIVVDNYSHDKTVAIAKKFGAKVIFNKISGIEKDGDKYSKMMGLRRAKGEYFIYLDADIEIVGQNWFRKLLYPLTKDRNIVGSFPRFIPKPDDAPIGRYLRYHPLELDPLFRFLTYPLEKTFIQSHDKFTLCRFRKDSQPPVGICLYRRTVLLEIFKGKEKFVETDVNVYLAMSGHDRFAYVPHCGFYHVNIKKLTDLLRKKKRNVDFVFLPNIEKRKFGYANIVNSASGWLKLLFWTAYANLFIPLLIKGITMAIRYRDWACLYEPVVALAVTDYVAWCFLRNPKGRRLIREKLF